MHVKNLHDWNVTYHEAVALQNDIAGQLILADEGLSDTINCIAGADVSYSRGDTLFFATVVVLDAHSMEIIEEASWHGPVDFPYIPGLLSFREGPPILKACEKLLHVPDIIIFDGQGIAHPRGVGLASHLGLHLDIPAIGCAKRRLVGEGDVPGDNPGDWSPLWYKGDTVGAVLRTKRRVKPVFVSQGHKICLNSAISVVLSCTRGYKLPEPTRQAHLAVNRLRRRVLFSES